MAKAKPNRRSWFLILLIPIVSISFFSVYLKLQNNIKERTAQSAALAEEYEQLAGENNRLRNSLESGDEAKIIEEYARNQRGFVYPDEYVYYDVTPGND